METLRIPTLQYFLELSDPGPFIIGSQILSHVIDHWMTWPWLLRISTQYKMVISMICCLWCWMLMLILSSLIQCLSSHTFTFYLFFRWFGGGPSLSVNKGNWRPSWFWELLVRSSSVGPCLRLTNITCLDYFCTIMLSIHWRIVVTILTWSIIDYNNSQILGQWNGQFFCKLTVVVRWRSKWF